MINNDEMKFKAEADSYATNMNTKRWKEGDAFVPEKPPVGFCPYHNTAVPGAWANDYRREPKVTINKDERRPWMEGGYHVPPKRYVSEGVPLIPAVSAEVASVQSVKHVSVVDKSTHIMLQIMGKTGNHTYDLAKGDHIEITYLNPKMGIRILRCTITGISINRTSVDSENHCDLTVEYVNKYGDFGYPEAQTETINTQYIRNIKKLQPVCGYNESSMATMIIKDNFKGDDVAVAPIITFIPKKTNERYTPYTATLIPREFPGENVYTVSISSSLYTGEYDVLYSDTCIGTLSVDSDNKVAIFGTKRMLENRISVLSYVCDYETFPIGMVLSSKSHARDVSYKITAGDSTFTNKVRYEHTIESKYGTFFCTDDDNHNAMIEVFGLPTTYSVLVTPINFDGRESWHFPVYNIREENYDLKYHDGYRFKVFNSSLYGGLYINEWNRFYGTVLYAKVETPNPMQYKHVPQNNIKMSGEIMISSDGFLIFKDGEYFKALAKAYNGLKIYFYTTENTIYGYCKIGPDDIGTVRPIEIIRLATTTFKVMDEKLANYYTSVTVNKVIDNTTVDTILIKADMDSNFEFAFEKNYAYFLGDEEGTFCSDTFMVNEDGTSDIGEIIVLKHGAPSPAKDSVSLNIILNQYMKNPKIIEDRVMIGEFTIEQRAELTDGNIRKSCGYHVPVYIEKININDNTAVATTFGQLIYFFDDMATDFVEVDITFTPNIDFFKSQCNPAVNMIPRGFTDTIKVYKPATEDLTTRTVVYNTSNVAGLTIEVDDATCFDTTIDNIKVAIKGDTLIGSMVNIETSEFNSMTISVIDSNETEYQIASGYINFSDKLLGLVPNTDFFSSTVFSVAESSTGAARIVLNSNVIRDSIIASFS